jgi:hypothetical protein
MTDAPTTPKLTDLVLATRTFEEQGGSCPYQATGTILGQSFYFRFRHDYASLQIGESETFGIADVTGDDYSGSLSAEEFETLFRKLLKKHLKSLKI